ncbi:heterokaryon incompatibility protein-domain-containing protein [Xylaria flabelliformis]|nr:heterokaryon incompatibility protein-domain-containing protein [Xylaria flabelliformis]
MSSSTSVHEKSIPNILGFHIFLIGSSHVVEKIVDELCQRDLRFRFIQDSIHEFRTGDEEAGLVFGLYGLMHHVPELRPAASVPTKLQSPEELWEFHESSARTLNEILCVLIYEILDTFNINITIDQVPQKGNVEDYVKLIKDLHEQSKNLPLTPVESAPSKNPLDDKQERYTYQYPDSLASSSEGSKMIRVLHIAPGSGQSRVECHLEVRDLYVDQVDEALSYVWGQCREGRAIWIDGDTFQVNENLYEILTSLRHPHAPRTIWVDAICINQLDLNEKAQQVRHMDEIYSRAKKTTIWLSGPTPDLLPTDDPYDIFAPLPPRFGGQYDLISILATVRELELDNLWNTEHLTLGMMLAHCVNTIMSNEWWKRVWTIQEAFLPKEHPHLIFRGYEFTFGDLLYAIDTIRRFASHIPPKPPSTTELQDTSLMPEKEVNFVLNAFTFQLAYWQENNLTHLLPFLRPGLEHWGIKPKSHRSSIHYLLVETSFYKSTDPRDKYFALQALQPKGKGKLMYVDYTKPAETIFRHATARCYNTTKWLGMTATFKLLIESQPARCDVPSPSWVQDFTYSDACYHDSDTSRIVTFGGYLCNENNWQPEYPSAQNDICFATPSTLFCSGLSIDAICFTELIPDLRDDEHSLERLCTFLKDVQVRQNWMDNDGVTFSENEISMIESVCIALCDATMGHPERMDKLKAVFHALPMNEHINLLICLGQGINNMDLFTLGGPSSIQRASATRENIMRGRAEEISGKQYFITDKGLVGIATAPVTEGDILILREVKSSDGHSYVVQRYRMVARAVLSEKKDDMKKMMADLETRIFEIV